MTRNRFGICLLFAGAAAFPAAAQSNSKPNAADSAFAKKAAVGGMAKVELGRLAAQKASDERFKQFGQRMVDDHSKANDELEQAASQEGIDLPTELDAKHRQVQEKLSGLSGAAFDKAYMDDMVKDVQDVAEFQKEAGRGNSAVAGFAKEGAAHSEGPPQDDARPPRPGRGRKSRRDGPRTCRSRSGAGPGAAGKAPSTLRVTAARSHLRRQRPRRCFRIAVVALPCI